MFWNESRQFCLDRGMQMAMLKSLDISKEVGKILYKRAFVPGGMMLMLLILTVT